MSKLEKATLVFFMMAISALLEYDIKGPSTYATWQPIAVAVVLGLSAVAFMTLPGRRD